MVKTAPTPFTNGARTALQQYRVRADLYDLELQPFEPLRLEAIERLKLAPGEAVLDVGCGTGLSFAPLLEKLGDKGKVVGIEQCPEMIDKAQARIAKADWTNQVSLLQASAKTRTGKGRADAAIFHFTHDVDAQPQRRSTTCWPTSDRAHAWSPPGSSGPPPGPDRSTVLSWAPPCIRSALSMA